MPQASKKGKQMSQDVKEAKQVSKNINSVEDFAEQLSELAIGTEDVQKLMDFVHRLSRHANHLQFRLNHAAQMLGHSVIKETLIEQDYG